MDDFVRTIRDDDEVAAEDVSDDADLGARFGGFTRGDFSDGDTSDGGAGRCRWCAPCVACAFLTPAVRIK